MSGRSLMILIIEFIHTFPYGPIYTKKRFSNMNLLNNVLLIMVLLFLKVNIREAFCCNLVNLEDLLKLNYLSSNQ